MPAVSARNCPNATESRAAPTPWTATRATVGAASLRQAYVKKDSSNLASLMMPMDQLELLKEEAEGDFETFTTIALDFAIERIMIEGDNVDVFVHWQGLWKKNPDDPGFRQRGHAKLQWVGTQSILLRGVQGDVPFGMKARQVTIDPTHSPKKK